MNLPGKYIEKKTLHYFFGTLSRFTRNSRGVCVCVGGGGGGGGGNIIMLQSTLITEVLQI